MTQSGHGALFDRRAPIVVRVRAARALKEMLILGIALVNVNEPQWHSALRTEWSAVRHLK